MRVCFFLHRFPELSQTFVLNQVVWFLERGHDVEIIAARPGRHSHLHRAIQEADSAHAIRRRTLYTGMPESMVVRAASALWPLFQAMLHRPSALRQALDVQRYGWFALTGSLLHSAKPLLLAARSYDAIVAHFGPEGVVADTLRQMTLLRGPLVTFFHGYDLTLAPRSVGHRMYRSLFRNGDCFLAICDHGVRKLLDLGADPSRTQVHHMGVNVERFRPREDRPCGRASLRVLSVGRLVAKKGFDIGIDTVAAVLHGGVSVDYRIIGEGPQRDALASRIRAGGLEQSVHLLGPVGEEAVVEALRDTDVLLAPSISAPDGDHEGIPMVLMEALASGVPVVASAHGGIPELVRHGESGLLVQERDSVAGAEALRMLALNPETRLRIGQQGRARVAIDFNADVQNARLERLLEDLVARTPGH